MQNQLPPAAMDALDDIWWLDAWQLPPQVVDEIPYRQARWIRAVRSALDKGRADKSKAEQAKAERKARSSR